MALSTADRADLGPVRAEAAATFEALRETLARDGVDLDPTWVDGTDFDAVATHGDMALARVTLQSGSTHAQVDVHPPEAGAFALIGHWPRLPRGDAGAMASALAEVRDLFRAALVAAGAIEPRDFPTTEKAIAFCRDLAATRAAAPSSRALVKAAKAVASAGARGATDRGAALDVLHACASTRPDAASEAVEPGFATATRRARIITQATPDRLEAAWRRSSHVGWLLDPPTSPAP